MATNKWTRLGVKEKDQNVDTTTISDEIKRLGLIGKEFNTNNQWGFGGGRGKCYCLPDGSELRVGTADYRHLPSTRFTKLYTKTNTTEEKKDILKHLKQFPDAKKVRGASKPDGVQQSMF